MAPKPSAAEHLTKEDLRTYLSGADLADADAERIEAHVGECRACALLAAAELNRRAPRATVRP